MLSRGSRIILVLLAVIAFGSTDAWAGKIVVAHDEWTLSDFGFTVSGGLNEPGLFATNVAAWFTGGGTGRFHAYSTNFGLAQPLLASAMTSAGHSWTTGIGLTFDLPTLLTFDGIFLAGNAAPNNVLIDYVNAGGNVYLAGGTGLGGAANEAARWNTFLNQFGLAFVATAYNGVSGSLPMSSPHPIFAGVDFLYQNNGNSILHLGGPNAEILIDLEGEGLYAVFSMPGGAAPEPTTLFLFGFGLLAAGAGLRKRRSSQE